LLRTSPPFPRAKGCRRRFCLCAPTTSSPPSAGCRSPPLPRSAPGRAKSPRPSSRPAAPSKTCRRRSILSLCSTCWCSSHWQRRGPSLRAARLQRPARGWAWWRRRQTG
jgi:hypothetical protein